MSRVKRFSITTCSLVLAAMVGCADEVPFAEVPSDAVQALIAGTPATLGGQSATRLSDGRWLLLGGGDAKKASTWAALQRDGAASEPLVQGLARARFGQTATVMPGGRVLVAGGRGADGRLVTNAEWFAPEAPAFTTAMEVHLSPRARHTATLLTDGRVLLAGGETDGGAASDTAEVLDSRTLQVTRLSARMQTARAGHSAVLLPDGRVLLTGGDAPGSTPTAELFDPSTQRFVRLDATERERLLQVDRALTVAGSIPGDSVHAVPVQSLLSVRLSHPVLPGDAEAVILSGPLGAVEANVTYAESGRLIFIHPEQALLPATAYTLYVQGLKDEADAALPLTTVGFTTASLAAGMGAHDVRLPRPEMGRAAAKAQPVASLRPTEKKGANGRYDWRAPERPLFDDGETWLPGPENFTGSWRSHEPKVTPVEPLQAPAGVTALSGRVLRLNGKPLAGVRVVVRGVATETDSEGRFLVAGLKPGSQTLEVNGQTANHGNVRYGLFFMHVDVEEGHTNPLGHTVWMPRLDPQGTVSMPSPTTEEVALTTPAIPGLELRLPPGTVVRDRAGNILTEINITPIPINQAPFPLPNLEMPLYFTLQPGDARFEGLTPGFSGARLYYANYRGELPGAKANFWNYDANGSGWIAYGLGSISADARQVIPDDGVALYGFVGAGFSNPDAPPPPVGGGCNTECCGGGGGEGGGGCNGGSAGAPGSLTGGDPVMLSSGQFLTTDVDLVVQDIVPIRMERTYRSLDLTRRQFGVGMTSNYEMFLWRPTSDFTQYELVNPDGTRIRYERISPGTNYPDAVFETTYPGPWSGSRITYNSRLMGWDLTFRNGQRLSFNHAHRLAEVADPHGNVVLITRQNGTSGPITRIDGPSGRWVEFTIDTNSLTTQAKDSGGRVVAYAYDTQGRLLQVTDAAGGTRKYTYNASNFMATVVDEENRLVIQNEYGSRGRVSKQTLVDGSTFEFTYTPNLVVQCYPNGPCDVRDGEQVIRTEVKDRAGLVRRVDFNSGYIVRDAYPAGRPEERVTTFDVAPTNGRRVATTDFAGRRTEYVHDARGNVTQATHLAGTPNAVTMQYTYTADNKLTSVRDELGHLTVYRYDEAGNLARVEDPTGRVSEYTHDSQGRLTSVRIGTDGAITYGYEGADLVALTDAGGRTTEFIRDALGRMVARRSPGGQVDRYQYDARDRLTRHTNPLGHTTAFTYDKTGKFTRVKDPRGKETLYSYNALGQLTERMDPLGRTEAFGYDLAGRLTSFRDRKGQVSGWNYNAAGRLTSRGFGATATSPQAFTNSLSYAYDSVQRLNRVEDSLGPVVTFTYDPLDRLVENVTPNGAVGYTYDAANRLTGVSAPGQAPGVYAYDDAGRLTTITQGSRTVAFTYDASGRRASTTLPGGVTQRYTYDASGTLTRIEYSRGTTVLGDLSYGFDANGDRVSTGGTFARTGLPQSVAGAVYDAASQLTTWKGRTLTYDANGNLVSDGLKNYTWDVRGHLERVSDSLATLAEFAYEPMGRRSRKTVAGVSTDYLYSGANTIEERSNGVSTQLLTGLGMDEAYSRQSPSGTHDFLTDVLGSTVALSDDAGALSAEYSYEPYGASTHTGSAAGNTRTFTGREEDGTGLHYFRNRYYDAETGRFLQPEPLLRSPTYVAQMALQGRAVPAYGYAQNNPLGFVDPDGLASRCPGGYWVGAPIALGEVSIGGFGGLGFGGIYNCTSAAFTVVVTSVCGFAFGPPEDWKKLHVGCGVGFGLVKNTHTLADFEGWSVGGFVSGRLGVGITGFVEGHDIENPDTYGAVIGPGGGLSAGVLGCKTWAWEL
ncbi:type IV secretion protein Rhs [Corallococcus sp. H22C18031201]|nr:type IV secretion protein Rhs [Corallococcus sp. H22C18031201]